MPDRVARSVRVVPGEIESGTVTTRFVIPTAVQGPWSPFVLVNESIATRQRQMPAHAHEQEEVLTYVIDGYAAYQLASGSVELLAPGAARLLSVAQRSTHRISPATGGAIRWFNVVVKLAASVPDSPRIQSAEPGTGFVTEDDARVRRLVGPNAPMASASGLECTEIVFPEESTTFRRIGSGRRAILYVSSGRGTVDQQEVETGEGALIEGASGTAVGGRPGFRCLLIVAPAPALRNSPSAAPPK